ncbi:alpha/beta-hydrolase [Earliella scabrosa]|nr:alpha/beta-hydrolase [Earliella scabrosa]
MLCIPLCQLEPSNHLEWTPCYTKEKCARLLVPLDYDTPDGPAAAIAVRMIPATDKENYRGTIFVNPGGPGGAATYLVGRRGEQLSSIVGPSFDILGFDPRGTGWSTPTARCFDTDSDREIWNVQEGHSLLNASEPSVGLFHSRAKLLAQRCEHKIGGEWGIGRFVSTANVARDMLEISQMLGQDQVQFWGFSYGSVLGQYFAAMYSDKVKRVVVDGVYDAENYRATLWNTNLVDADAAYQSLFDYCHRAGPDRCAIYESEPSKIRQRYFKVLDNVKRDPVAVPLAEPPIVITHKALLQQLFFQGAYAPLRSFSLIVDTIRAIETGNTSALTALAPSILSTPECKCKDLPDTSVHMDTEATFAIACGDGDPLAWDLESYKAYYKTLESASQLMAPLWGNYWLQCAEWTIRANWRWTGPLEARNTSHPLLVLSTRYDPVTPLPDARVVQERFAGAGLLVQDSVGHCSLSSPSVCTAKHVRRYFEDGVLPEEGTTCGVDELPLIGKVESEGNTLDADDAELLVALKSLSDVFPLYGPL